MRCIVFSWVLVTMLLVGVHAVPEAASASLPAAALGAKAQPRVGDLDVMIARRTIRALVVYSKTFYFLDGVKQRGLSYELLKAFESFVNRKHKTGVLKINLIIIPVARNELLPALLEGRGDLAVANLTITDKRKRQVDFSVPFMTGVSEVVVSGSQAPSISNLEYIAGRLIEVRRSSSYYESLVALNKRLEAAGLDPVRIELADENLEDEDLLEMVNAGLLPAIVMDSHKAHFWQQIFPAVTIQDVYLADEPLDPLNRTLLTFAAYNAGPSRIMRLRREAARQGLDPNRWFHNVENIAARQIGRETVQYVSNIYKYYIAYRQVTEKREHRNIAIENRGAI